MDRGKLSCVMRALNTDIPDFSKIGLPDSVQQLLNRPRGLMLVTGPTGSGKTTTLASSIDWINNNHSHHILTIEDPIEFVGDLATTANDLTLLPYTSLKEGYDYTFGDGNFEFGASASAALITEGANASVDYTNGVAVMTFSKGGLMYEASIGGQKFTFKGY